MRKFPKLPLLREQRTRDLKSVLDWMLDEVDLCDQGLAPKERGTFIALAALIDLELRFRDPRRKPALVAGQPECLATKEKP